MRLHSDLHCNLMQAVACLPANRAPPSACHAGLAAIQAGVHPHEIGAAVLIDPVDFTSQSRVSRMHGASA